MTAYLHTSDVAAICGVEERTVREWTRTYRVPHRRLPKVRRCLFIEEEVRAWVDDPTIPLDVKRGADGARVVKPVAP